MKLFLLACALCILSGELSGGEDKAIGTLRYPEELRHVRQLVLKEEGWFAIDIAFAIRTCKNCKKPYVMGKFPRTSRNAFHSLADVHKLIEQRCVQTPPPERMFSEKEGREIPRACPYCKEPENRGSPDKILFCHLIPELNCDLQIEYEIAREKIVSRSYFKVIDEAPAAIVLPDEREASFKEAFGAHFSLREVWNEIFVSSFELDRPVYREVAPGMKFLFRPPRVRDALFKQFFEDFLKPERDKGVFDRIESPLKLDPKETDETYLEWAAAHLKQFKDRHAECFVTGRDSVMQQAVVEALKPHKIEVEFDPRSDIARLKRGGLKVDLNCRALFRNAVTRGLSLHQACAMDLSEGVHMLNAAEKLNTAIRAARTKCVFEIVDGKTLVLRDKAKNERKVDLMTMAGRVNSQGPLFDLFCNVVLAWDDQTNLFGPKPDSKLVSAYGLPAFVELRIRPAGYLDGKPAALIEPREDANRKRFDLCYTLEDGRTVTYIDPSKPQFEKMTLEEARKTYELTGGLMPMLIEAQTELTFPGGVPELVLCKAKIVCGSDLASLAATPRLATALANTAEVADNTQHIYFYAFNTNCAALSPRKLSDDEFSLVKSRAQEFLKESAIEPGQPLDLYFDLPRGEPRGKVLRRVK